MARSFYESGNINVDENFARFGSKSFAIDKVNSVEVRRQEVGNPKATIYLCLTIVLLLISLSGSPVAIFFLIVAGLATYGAFKNPPKDKHHLFIMTSSSEAQAFESTSVDQVAELRNAIEEAMVFKTRRIGE